VKEKASMLVVRCCLSLAILTVGGCRPSDPALEKLAPGVNVEVVRTFVGRQSECKGKALNLVALGPFTRMEDTDGGLRVFINERDWDEASRDTRISWVQTFYCGFMPSDGRFAVHVFGVRRAEAMGRMVDGNYSD
jgi:hypothetical protein